jgi:hypothetical protein
MAVCALATADECYRECQCKALVEAELNAQPRPATPLSWVQPASADRAESA